MRNRANFGQGTIVVLLALCAHAASGTMIDLTTAGASGVINDAIFQQIDPRATGTGVIDSFAQIGAANQVEVQAYNTTVNNVLNNGAPDNFNHSITLGIVPIVSIETVDYYQFLLDINENNNAALDQYLSLDEVQIFVGDTPNPSSTSFDADGILQGVGTLVYDMESNLRNWVALDYSLNTGSGSGDMFLYVPVSNFGGAGDDAIVTLYSYFGRQGLNPAEYGEGNFGNFYNSDGFEEWAVLVQEDPIAPEPATLSLIGLGIAGLVVRRFTRTS
ncbi:MAG TPA: PEP-CTERM sorting domain-containing protein [Candidatus Hydrogenedentes bacterium]|nr:PEP-CTERM sorting domain-containing protein [Candidatus Hydrogenedentota bacterium]HQM47372.1 PEP-CTERM sorting domain-containing protein [Candidatus Hydrogenedentota bacterium]